MSWLYDDQDLSNQAQAAAVAAAAAAAAAADSASIHPSDDFELFHEQVAPIDVDEADLAPATTDQGIKHVRVRNLQWWTNETTIRELLSDCGLIKSIEFEASMKNGKSLGIANIEFDSSDAALRAIDQIDNREIDGKPVNANLLVVEDIKVSALSSQSSQSQRPLHPPRNLPAASPRRPIRSPASRTGPPGRDPAPAPDQSRIPNAAAREGSTVRAGKPVDHRHDVDRASTAARPGDRVRGPAAPPPPPHHHGTGSSGGGGDADHIGGRSTAGSGHHHDDGGGSRRPEPEIHRDRERLIHHAGRGAHTRSASSRPDSHQHHHHPIEADLSRRSSYPDDRSHSRRAESERSSRDLRSDHDRSRHGSHRDLDDGRLSSRRLHEYSRDHHGPGYERHADRHHARPELDGLDRYSRRRDSDHRSRKRRR